MTPPFGGYRLAREQLVADAALLGSRDAALQALELDPVATAGERE